MPQQREPDRRLARARLADQPQDLSGRDAERDVVDDILAGAFHDDPQAVDNDGGLDDRHAAPRVRSMPAAARAMPSPISPVPMVSSAMAATGRTTPHGWTVRAMRFSLIIRPQSGAPGLVVNPRNASAAMTPMA